MKRLLFIVTLVSFLIWAAYAARQSRVSWHSLVSIYLVTLIFVDYGDVLFDYWLGFYDLPAHLLKNPASDHYLGIIFSDGLIFPVIAIVYCSYAVRLRHLWRLSAMFAVLLGLIEVGFVRLGYMVYHHWNSWITPAIAFLAFQLLAHFAPRFVHYAPPIPAWLRLVSVTYVITEWPGAILSGIMHLYQWRLHIFADPYADDRLVAMSLASLMGGLVAVLVPRLRHHQTPYLFLGLGLLSTLIALVAYRIGWLQYNGWNHLWTIIRYMTPYLVVYWYYRWEFHRVNPVSGSGT